jgi:hypothetical protein
MKSFAWFNTTLEQRKRRSSFVSSSRNERGRPLRPFVAPVAVSTQQLAGEDHEPQSLRQLLQHRAGQEEHFAPIYRGSIGRAARRKSYFIH